MLLAFSRGTVKRNAIQGREQPLVVASGLWKGIVPLWGERLRKMLITSRCVLQVPTDADASAIVLLMTHPEVRRYLGGPATPERAAAYAATLTNVYNLTA